jgi:hypothetical protein
MLRQKLTAPYRRRESHRNLPESLVVAAGKNAALCIGLLMRFTIASEA